MEFCKGILASFFSPQFYSVVGREEKKMRWSFIWTLTAVMTVSTVLMLLFAVQLAGTQSGLGLKNIQGMVSTLPAVTVKGGKLSIDKSVPYEIKLGNSAYKVVIDTGYKVDSLATLRDYMKHNNIIALITEDAAITPDGQDDIKIHNFDKAQDSVIGHGDWENFARWIGDRGIYIIPFWMTVVMAVATFVYNLLATLLSAIVVTFLGLVLGAKLDFDAGMRLAAVARLPACVICFLPFIRGGVGWMIWAAYMIFAVMACRAKPPTQTAA